MNSFICCLFFIYLTFTSHRPLCLSDRSPSSAEGESKGLDILPLVDIPLEEDDLGPSHWRLGRFSIAKPYCCRLRLSLSSTFDSQSERLLDCSFRCVRVTSCFSFAGKFYLAWLFIATMAVVYNYVSIVFREAFDVYVTEENLFVWLACDYVADFIYILDICLLKNRIRFINSGIVEARIDLSVIGSKCYFPSSAFSEKLEDVRQELREESRLQGLFASTRSLPSLCKPFAFFSWTCSPYCLWTFSTSWEPCGHFTECPEC